MKFLSRKRRSDPHLPPRTAQRLHMMGDQNAAVESGINRLSIIAAVFSLIFVVIAGRLVELAVIRSPGESVRVAGQSNVRGGRADIVDRNGVLLAKTITMPSLFADTRNIQDPAEVADGILSVLPDLDRAKLVGDLSSGSAFVYIKRHISPDQQQRIHMLGHAGLQFQDEEIRVYPHGELTAQVVGMVDIDNRGIAGLEYSMEDQLSDPQRASNEVTLSIDLRVQHVLTDVIAGAMTEFNAIGGAALILDNTNGEVLGLVSLPDIDPHGQDRRQTDNTINRLVTGTYEMGSVFKIFTAAIGLDTHAVSLNDHFDISRPIRWGRFSIGDYHWYSGAKSVPFIFAKSSNVGTVHMQMAIGAKNQKDYFGRLGLLETIAFELPGVGTPQLPARWTELDMMVMSYGHSISVTPLQAAAAVGTIVHDGRRVCPTVILHGTPANGCAREQVISASVSRTMRDLMRLVVEEGTGKRADTPGYPVIGKTGTADKAVRGGRGYKKNSNLASFVGAFPYNDPRYTILVMMDEPRGNKETSFKGTAGLVAAPIVSRIVGRIAPILGIAPSVAPPQDSPDRTFTLAALR